MTLEPIEFAALLLIFRGSDVTSVAIRDRFRQLIILQRKSTGVGFFLNVWMPLPIEVVPEMRMWEFNFKHPAFPLGGSFMCTIENKNTLELEGVTLGDAKWPRVVDLNVFVPLGS